MSELATVEGRIPAMNAEAVNKVRDIENMLRTLPQADIHTDHLIHAGMYSRTIRIPAGVILTGALIKIETVLVFSGKATVYVGDRIMELEGYHVLAASAGRKQVFVTHEDTWLTMIFPSQARSVSEAESEFTDEAEMLMSRTGGEITKEALCLVQ